MEAYLDNSATTRVDAQVQELMKKLMDVDFGNPSSRHQKMDSISSRVSIIASILFILLSS